MTDRTVLVTGGANGIGKRTAELFVAAGAFVVVADINERAGSELVESLGQGRAMFLRLDVSDEAAVASTLSQIATRRGTIDVLFNNAGTADPRPDIEGIDTPHFRKVVETILLGTMLVTKYALPLMRERGGAIINTASVTGLSVSGGSSVYAAAKAGVINFTRYAAVELGPLGIRVNSVCPGGVAAPLLFESMGATADSIDLNAVHAGLVATQAIDHVNEPEDIAQAVLYLASVGASGVTGHNLVVDGGYLVANKGRA